MRYRRSCAICHAQIHHQRNHATNPDRTLSALFGLCFVLVAATLLLPPGARASDGEDTVEKVTEQSEAANDLFGDKRFFVMPIPISNPTLCKGLDASAMYLFQADESSRPSSLNLMGFYSDTESWTSGLGTSAYFKDDNRRLTAWVGYFDVNLDFFGIGGGETKPIGINQNGTFFVARYLFEIAEQLYLGPQYRFSTIETSLQDSLPPGFPVGPYPDSIESTTSGLGAVLERDTRDIEFYPYGGGHFEATVNFAHEALGSDDDYQQYEAGYNHYWGLGAVAFAGVGQIAPALGDLELDGALPG